MTNQQQEITWNAEFRFLMPSFGVTTGQTSGIQVRHTSLVQHNDVFPWPTGSASRQPQSWGDMFLLGASLSTPGQARVDRARVTQGLEWDVAQSANKAYELVERKDAYMSTQLYTLGAITDLTYSACQVQRIAPSSDSVQTVPTVAAPAPVIAPYPTGVLSGAGAFNCWIPGSMLSRPGLYSFSVRIRMVGGEFQTIPIADRRVEADRSVRLMIYRWRFPIGHRERRTWDAELNASAVDAMSDIGRVLPVPSGVGSFAFSSSPTRAAPGVRYFFSPTVYDCSVRLGETVNQAKSRCDATTRNNADLDRMGYDDQAARLDSADGRHRDRIDLQEVFVSTPASGGGQSCWANSASAGSGLDSQSTGVSHFVPIQESQHCWGEVEASSPHAIPSNTSHSQNYFLRPAGGLPMVNTQTRQLISNPRGMMSPDFFGDDNNTTFVNEGTEFNRLRQTLVNLRPPSGAATPSALANATAGARTQIELAFLIDRDNHVTLQSSRRVLDSMVTASHSDASSNYRLAFRDADGAVLKSFPFEVTAAGEHGPIPITGVVLNVVVPAHSKGVDIIKGSTRLFREKFSSRAPRIGPVDTQQTSPNTMDVTWTGTDSDSPDLRANIYFQQHPEGLRMPIAHGVKGDSFTFDTSYLPGTADGVIGVELSDGFKTSTGYAERIAVSDKDPYVSITAPDDGGSFTEGQPIRFTGSAYDPNTMGTLPGEDLTWSSDIDGSLGNGAALSQSLKPGKHTITLTAAPAGGRTTKTVIHLNVLADSDGSGLPDAYELERKCFSTEITTPPPTRTSTDCRP